MAAHLLMFHRRGVGHRNTVYSSVSDIFRTLNVGKIPYPAQSGWSLKLFFAVDCRWSSHGRTECQMTVSHTCYDRVYNTQMVRQSFKSIKMIVWEEEAVIWDCWKWSCHRCAKSQMMVLYTWVDRLYNQQMVRRSFKKAKHDCVQREGKMIVWRLQWNVRWWSLTPHMIVWRISKWSDDRLKAKDDCMQREGIRHLRPL